jgi:hypothetical protein
MAQVTKYFVEANGSRAEIKEVYESFSGWYWFLTDVKDKQVRIVIDDEF